MRRKKKIKAPFNIPFIYKNSDDIILKKDKQKEIISNFLTPFI